MYVTPSQYAYICLWPQVSMRLYVCDTKSVCVYIYIQLKTVSVIKYFAMRFELSYPIKKAYFDTWTVAVLDCDRNAPKCLIVKWYI